MKILTKEIGDSKLRTRCIAVRSYGEKDAMLFEIAEDCRVEDFYRSYNHIPAEASESLVRKEMEASSDALCSAGGKHILFRDFAASEVTLGMLGFDANEVYVYACGYTDVFAA